MTEILSDGNDILLGLYLWKQVGHDVYRLCMDE